MIGKCRVIGYPVKVTALGLIMHSAPRRIRAHDHHIPVGRPYNGTIAGGTQSNHFARIFMHAIISKVQEGSPYNAITQRPWNDVRTFVDDVSHTVRARWHVGKHIKAAGILNKFAEKKKEVCPSVARLLCLQQTKRREGVFLLG